MKNELTISHVSGYQESCPANKEQLRSALDNISHNLGQGQSATVTIECRETDRSTTATIKYRGPNQGHYPIRVATAIINRVSA